ncbi:MAG: SEC-C metal-binding domain-containing protein, partial [Desulforhabdus sp.]|nr:SEC-C metal-binding domain-containing protein [Desulforhabdus sp.]
SRTELDTLVQSYQQSRRQTSLPDQLTTEKVGRNEPCPCGSGKKYKKCCLASHEEARKSIPADQLREMEKQQKLRERLEKDVEKGFDLLFSKDFSKAQQFAARLLQSYPEDDRLHDIVVMASMVTGDYDGAVQVCRRRWQVAQEEKEFFQENGYHKREGAEKKELVFFYSPSTWLEKLWMAQRARAYREKYPVGDDERLIGLVENLKIVNDVKRFPARQEEGYEVRRQALAPVLAQLEEAGPAAVPYLLPLAYSYSWASLFVPDLLSAYRNRESARLLAELSMFRFPFFAQKCLVNLENFEGMAVAQIEKVMEENPAFDELKVGLLEVLGNIRTSESFGILARMTEHHNPYVVKWASDALGRHQNPEALPYIERAKERLGEPSKIAGAIQDLARAKGA